MHLIKQRGTILQTFMQHWLLNWPLKLTNNSTTSCGMTHFTPKRLNTDTQKTLATLDWSRRWSIDSVLFLHMQRQSITMTCIFLRLSKVKIFPSVSYSNRGGEKGQEISGKIGWCTFNQLDPTTILGHIKPLPTCQMTFHFFLIMPFHIDFPLNCAPNDKQIYFIGKENSLQPRILAKLPSSSMKPTFTSSNLAVLIFNRKTTSKHKRRQHNW